MEQLGLDAATMRRRVEETLDLLGIAELRNRDLRTLSGGQQQRVAIGSVLTMHPRVLVLDEPTSALDPTAAEEVLATLTRLVHDLGVTVVLAEHRLERVVPFADRIVLVEGDGVVRAGEPAAMLRALSRRAADRRAGPLGRLVAAAAVRARRPPRGPRPRARPAAATRTVRRRGCRRPIVLEARGVTVAYGRQPALRGSRPRPCRAGEVTALMGRNGSRQVHAVVGAAGHASVVRRDGARRRPGPGGARRRRPPRARRAGAADGGRPALPRDRRRGVRRPRTGRRSLRRVGARSLLDRLAPGIDRGRHPRDLSEGQRLALVLAIVLTARAAGGLPRRADARSRLPGQGGAGRDPRGLAADGRAVLVATHDVEFVAQVADRVVVLAEGEVVSEGPTARVVAESPAFAPQVHKILGDGWLTVDQVRRGRSDDAPARTVRVRSRSRSGCGRRPCSRSPRWPGC